MFSTMKCYVSISVYGLRTIIGNKVRGVVRPKQWREDRSLDQ